MTEKQRPEKIQNAPLLDPRLQRVPRTAASVRGSLTCCECGRPVHRESKADGTARCLGCKMSRPKIPPPLRPVGATTGCTRCGKPFVVATKGQRLCHAPCSKRGGVRKDGLSATERGYGVEHQRARAAARAAWRDGDPCARCGGPMRFGDDVDLDHNDDRSGYLGLSHAAYNRAHTSTPRVREQHSKVCDCCGCTYMARYLTQRFCSNACRLARRSS